MAQRSVNRTGKKYGCFSARVAGSRHGITERAEPVSVDLKRGIGKAGNSEVLLGCPVVLSLGTLEQPSAAYLVGADELGEITLVLIWGG
jgi:hypothetical protein